MQSSLSDDPNWQSAIDLAAALNGEIVRALREYGEKYDQSDQGQ